MRRHNMRGFTIVELLIVIVVIAVLASITVVAYRGVSERANFSKMQSDFSSIQKALELYKTDNGEYPKADATRCYYDGITNSFQSNWCGWGQSTGDSFIPGLSPKYLGKIPTLNSSIAEHTDSYIYRSSPTTNGANSGSAAPHMYYQLVRFKSSGLTATEKSNNPNLYIASGGNGYTGNEAWGIKSDPSMGNW